MSQFASAKPNRYLNLVSVCKKFFHMLGLKIEIVIVDFRLHTNFLEFLQFLFLLGFAKLFLHFETVLAIIKNLASGRIRRRCNFYQVKTEFTSHIQRLKGRDYTLLFAFIINKSDLAYTDLFIYP